MKKRDLTPIRTVFVLGLLLAAQATFAGEPARPPSFDRAGTLAIKDIAAWTSPAIDVARLLDEDAVAGRLGLPLRIGFPMAVDLDPTVAGTWEDLGNGDRLWRLRVESEDALWIVLGFDAFRLQAGASLWIYDAARRTILGPFTTGDVKDHGELWTPPIEGDAVVVEVLWPSGLRDRTPRIHLGTVSHGYKPFGTIGRAVSLEREGTAGIGDSGSCNIDVNCALGASWQDEKRGVVILLSGGSSFCSGSLINNTASDCRPYVLTAAHCGAGTSTSFGFNFERTGCGTGNPPPPATQSVTGATVRANYSSSDVTLLEMSALPPESFGFYFNGWSRDPNPSTQSWVIHHPSGDVKKISFDDDPPVNGTNYGSNHWRIQNYEQGTTEGGSSGSPLFDQNGRITGQLHGGTASCSSITWDEFGKIAASWTGGGAPSSRLSDWLDPSNTGAIVQDGLNGTTCFFQPAGTIALTRSAYACADTMVIRLRDDSLQGNPTQGVTIVSATEAVPESAVLTATAPGSGQFEGTFPTAPISAAAGDGQLSVAHGDTITVTYIDADDGQGNTNVTRTAAATVDCVAPTITAVQAQDVSGNSARITWTTNEPTDGRVRYGTTPPPSGSTYQAPLVTAHATTVTGLAECTRYVYGVESADAVANQAADNAGGAWYAFKTLKNVTPVYASTGAPVAIPDNNANGATSTIDVTEAQTVLEVKVEINITHTYDGDLEVSLIAPNGTTVSLANRQGGSGDNFRSTVFDDAASVPISSGSAPFTGTFRPETLLSAATGIPAAGAWRLKVVDRAGIDVGTIDSWILRLRFATGTCPTTPPPVPDGRTGAPARASRATPDGTAIDLTWDVATCAGTDYHVLHGALAGVSTYQIDGASCDLGTSGTATWSGVPAGDLWFVVVADDGATTEGSWGRTSQGAERGGSVVSGLCSMAARDNAGTCP